MSEPKNHLCQVFCTIWKEMLFAWSEWLYCRFPLCKSSFFFCSVFSCIFFDNKFLEEKPDCVLHLLTGGGLSVLLYPFPGSIASLRGYSPSPRPDFGRAITKLFFAHPCVEGPL